MKILEGSQEKDLVKSQGNYIEIVIKSQFCDLLQANTIKKLFLVSMTFSSSSFSTMRLHFSNSILSDEQVEVLEKVVSSVNTCDFMYAIVKN